MREAKRLYIDILNPNPRTTPPQLGLAATSRPLNSQESTRWAKNLLPRHAGQITGGMPQMEHTLKFT